MRVRLLIWLAAVTPLGFASKFYEGPGAAWVQGYAGGILYVVFWILLAALARPRSSPRIVAGAVLVMTSILEVLQLSSTPLLEAIRETFIGRTLIGSTFVWWDFPHYLLGAVIGTAIVSRIARDQG
ncbi:MAG: DUF2809 domain-containing protein [Myxococcota bacterium]